jgi:hypothetical protein
MGLLKGPDRRVNEALPGEPGISGHARYRGLPKTALQHRLTRVGRAVQGPGRRSRVQSTVSTGPIRCPICRLRGMGCHRLWRHCRPRVARSVMTSRGGKSPQEETAPMGYSPLLRRALRFDWSGRWTVTNRPCPAVDCREQECAGWAAAPAPSSATDQGMASFGVGGRPRRHDRRAMVIVCVSQKSAGREGHRDRWPDAALVQVLTCRSRRT